MASIHACGVHPNANPCSGPVPGLCSSPVISAGFPGFARVLQIVVSPAPIYRDLQGHFGGAALPTPDAQTPWHARNMVCELAGNVLRGAQGRTETVSFNQTLCPTSLRSPTTSRCRPAAPSKEKSPCVPVPSAISARRLSHCVIDDLDALVPGRGPESRVIKPTNENKIPTAATITV
jgi:hypothetical protein